MPIILATWEAEIRRTTASQDHNSKIIRVNGMDWSAWFKQ
jgi:hypothetical protein